MSGKAHGTTQIHQCLLYIQPELSLRMGVFSNIFLTFFFFFFKLNFNALRFSGIYLSKNLENQLWNISVVLHHVRVPATSYPVKKPSTSLFPAIPDPAVLGAISWFYDDIWW